jgi:hypothetical protein
LQSVLGFASNISGAVCLGCLTTQDFERICRSRGISFYVDCQLIYKPPASKANFKFRGYLPDSAHKSKFFLQLARKEASSKYSKGIRDFAPNKAKELLVQ